MTTENAKEYLRTHASIMTSLDSKLRQEFDKAFLGTLIFEQRARIVIQISRDHNRFILADEMEKDLESEIRFKTMGV